MSISKISGDIPAGRGKRSAEKVRERPAESDLHSPNLIQHFDGFQVFADMGLSRPEGTNYTAKWIAQRGYGFGVTVAVLPYNIARAEIAFDEEGRSQLILDIGLSF